MDKNFWPPSTRKIETLKTIRCENMVSLNKAYNRDIQFLFLSLDGYVVVIVVTYFVKCVKTSWTHSREPSETPHLHWQLFCIYIQREYPVGYPPTQSWFLYEREAENFMRTCEVKLVLFASTVCVQSDFCFQLQNAAL